MFGIAENANTFPRFMMLLGMCWFSFIVVASGLLYNVPYCRMASGTNKSCQIRFGSELSIDWMASGMGQVKIRLISL